jgi:hypothetical protein
MDWETLMSLFGGLGAGGLAGGGAGAGELGDLMQPAMGGNPMQMILGGLLGPHGLTPSAHGLTPAASEAPAIPTSVPQGPASASGYKYPGAVPGGLFERGLDYLTGKQPPQPSVGATINREGKTDLGGRPTGTPMAPEVPPPPPASPAPPQRFAGTSAQPPAGPESPGLGGSSAGIPLPRPRPPGAPGAAPGAAPGDFGDRLVKALAAVRPPNTPQPRLFSQSQPQARFNPGNIQRLLQLALAQGPQGGGGLAGLLGRRGG